MANQDSPGSVGASADKPRLRAGKNEQNVQTVIWWRKQGELPCFTKQRKGDEGTTWFGEARKQQCRHLHQQPGIEVAECKRQQFTVSSPITTSHTNPPVVLLQDAECELLESGCLMGHDAPAATINACF